jgi:hypothetical protein
LFRKTEKLIKDRKNREKKWKNAYIYDFIWWMRIGW